MTTKEISIWASLIAGLGALIFAVSRIPECSAPRNTPTPEPVTEYPIPWRDRTPTIVQVPAGVASVRRRCGSTELVLVPAFEIDEYPVTYRQFEVWRAKARRPTFELSDRSYGLAFRPVFDSGDIEELRRFCNDRGMDLPSLAEWTRAARGAAFLPEWGPAWKTFPTCLDWVQVSSNYELCRWRSRTGVTFFLEDPEIVDDTRCGGYGIQDLFERPGGDHRGLSRGVFRCVRRSP